MHNLNSFLIPHADVHNKKIKIKITFTILFIRIKKIAKTLHNGKLLLFKFKLGNASAYCFAVSYGLRCYYVNFFSFFQKKLFIILKEFKKCVKNKSY